MPRSVDETRREFLLRLAKGAAFVPPALLTLDVSGALGQKSSGGGSGGKGGTTTTTSGGISPVAALSAPTQLRTQESQATPWQTGRASGDPPWSKPPPTPTGRE